MCDDCSLDQTVDRVVQDVPLDQLKWRGKNVLDFVVLIFGFMKFVKIWLIQTASWLGRVAKGSRESIRYL